MYEVTFFLSSFIISFVEFTETGNSFPNFLIQDRHLTHLINLAIIFRLVSPEKPNKNNEFEFENIQAVSLKTSFQKLKFINWLLPQFPLIT